MNRKSLGCRSPQVPTMLPTRPPSRDTESISYYTDGQASQTAHNLGGLSSNIDGQNASTYGHNLSPTSTEYELEKSTSDLTDPSLLSFLSYPMDTSGYTNEISGGVTMRDMSSLPGQSGTSADPLLHQIDFLSTAQALDGNFDWFSRDAYSWNSAGNGI